MRVVLGILALLLAGPGAGHPGDSAALAMLDRQIAAGSRQARLERVMLLAHTGAHEDAQRELAALGPLGAAESWVLGRLALQAGDPGAAIGHLDAHLLVAPQHSEAWRLRSRAWERLDQAGPAARDLQRFIESEAGAGPSDYLRLVDLLSALEAGPDAGLAVLDLGVRRLGPNVLLQERAVEIEVAAERHEQAIARWQSVADITDRSARWRFRLAELLAEAGEARAARSELGSLIALLDGARPVPAHRQLRAQAVLFRDHLAER